MTEVQIPLGRAAFSVPEIMVQIGLSRDKVRDKVYGLIREGKLKARKVGRRTLVTSTDLQEFLQALPTLGQPA
jgi:excisionase family DNA binding protein